LIPFEFIVTGSPVSLQTNNRAKLQEWKAKVGQIAAEAMPIGMSATSEPVQVIIIPIFYEAAPEFGSPLTPLDKATVYTQVELEIK
jgi:crossover junction endodeoxyribonuclease RusA